MFMLQIQSYGGRFDSSSWFIYSHKHPKFPRSSRLAQSLSTECLNSGVPPIEKRACLQPPFPLGTMPNIASRTQHHGPKASEGNCRKMRGERWCRLHQMICPKHLEQCHLKDEECPQCAKIVAIAAGKIRKENEARKNAERKQIAAENGGKWWKKK